ncbi:MAG: hypothetical protein QXU87_04060 [Candidatus Caldarchaeum sp.]
MSEVTPVKTGSFIDQFEGLYPGVWHLFYGPDGSGKTLGCLIIALSFLKTYPDKHVVYVVTESVSAFNERKMCEKLVSRFGLPAGVLERVVFVDGFTGTASLHDFFLGREKGRGLADLAKRFNVGVLVVDSLTKFYSKEVGRAPQAFREAAIYGAKYFHVWYDHVGEVMKAVGAFPVMVTAWLASSRIAQALKKPSEQDVDKAFSDEEGEEGPREFVGGKHVAHLCKIRYRVMRKGFVMTYTQTRGPFMGKSVQVQVPV